MQSKAHAYAHVLGYNEKYKQKTDEIRIIIFFQAYTTVWVYLIIVCIFGMNTSILSLPACKPSWLQLMMRHNFYIQMPSMHQMVYANEVFSFYTPYTP